MNSVRDIAIVTILAILFFVAGGISGWFFHKAKAPVVREEVSKVVYLKDTLTVHDTVVSVQRLLRVDTVWLASEPLLHILDDTIFVHEDEVIVMDTVEVFVHGDSARMSHRQDVVALAVARDSALVVEVPVPVYVDTPTGTTTPKPSQPLKLHYTLNEVMLSGGFNSMDLMYYRGNTLRLGGGVSYDWQDRRVLPRIGIGVQW